MDVSFEPRFEAWRDVARALVAQGARPEEVDWAPHGSGGPGLFDEPATPAASPTRVHVPAAFLDLAQSVAMHRDDMRWPLLYRLLWRLVHESKSLLEDAADDDVLLAHRMASQVRRDIHKMHAFVRFKRFAGEERYLAWHVPDHHIVEAATPFFARRFATMRWTIMTPDASASWDGATLTFGAGLPAAPRLDDDLEDLWRTYYASIFNPARIKTRMMKREMPVRHWRTLPEAAIIDELLAEAPARVERMLAEQPASARTLVPEAGDLAAVARAARSCRACRICERATQLVFGEGPPDAAVVLVGEQPGDQEDHEGRPFVGPAGQLLDRALRDAGLDRSRLYLTNAVKHFKWEPSGKVRLHKRPDAAEVAACRPWLEAELARLRPRVLVCLGATAAQSVLGRAVKITAERGRFQRTAWTPHTLVTGHPSAILRAPDEATRAAMYDALVRDLARAAAVSEDALRSSPESRPELS